MGEVTSTRKATSNTSNVERKASRDVRGATEKGYSQRLARAVIARESQIRKNENESLHLFTSDGKEAFAKGGNNNSVMLTEADLAKLPKDGIFTHNHPSALSRSGILRIGNSFSPDDVRLAIMTNAREIRAVTPTYTFSLKRPAKGWGVSYSAIKTLLNRASYSLSRRNETYILGNDYSHYNTTRAEREAVTHWHTVMKEAAKTFGWIYTKKKG